MKSPSNVFISVQLSNNDVEFSKILPKNVSANKVNYSTIKITSKLISRNTIDISTKEITSKKVRKTRWICQPWKSLQKTYVETTWIFWPSKLHWKKYVKTKWIFRPSKLRRKRMWKRHGSSSKFGLQLIDVISTSNQRWFDVACPLVRGYRKKICAYIMGF